MAPPSLAVCSVRVAGIVAAALKAMNRFGFWQCSGLNPVRDLFKRYAFDLNHNNPDTCVRCKRSFYSDTSHQMCYQELCDSG